MIPLIKNKRGHRGQINTIELNRYLTMQRRNIDAAIEYYRGEAIAVDTASPLVKLTYLLNVLSDSPTLDPFNAFMRARQSANNYCLATGITSGTNMADPVYDAFYGKVPTAFVYQSFYDSTDIGKLADDWYSASPVRVLASPTQKEPFTRPDLINCSTGYCVIGVDLPALAVMSNAWRSGNMMLPLGQREREETFVARYVLPNMMYSAADATIVNMMDGDVDWFDKDDTKSQRPPIPIIDYSKYVMKAIKEHIDDLNASDVDFNKMAYNTPAYYAKDLTSTLHEFSSLITSTNRWVKLAIELPLVYGIAVSCINDTSPDDTRSIWYAIKRNLVTNRVVRSCPDRVMEYQMSFMYEMIQESIETRAL